MSNDLLAMLNRAADTIRAFDAQQEQAERDRSAFLERLDQGAHVLMHRDTLAPLSLVDADLYRHIQYLGDDRVHHNDLLPVGHLYAFDWQVANEWPLAGRAERDLVAWSERWMYRLIAPGPAGVTHVS